MKNGRTFIPVLNPQSRVRNFEEVSCGYSFDMAKVEAMRCLQCKKPLCVEGCPVHIDIPDFIKSIKDNDIEEAYKIITFDNAFPAICGRVCPQEKQCEGACIVGKKGEPIAIGALERFVGDFALKTDLKINVDFNENGIPIAVIGSGPAGLANAAAMRQRGYSVTVFEALHEFGGVLKYGIPDFRLPKWIVDKEIDHLKSAGVKFEKNILVGKSITINQLIKEEGFRAVFIGTGAGLPSSLGIKGENFAGVYYANEFLTRVNLMHANEFPIYATPVKVGDNVAVIGGGNVAMDAARTAKRLGAKNVFIFYRRDMESLPARKEEIQHAIEEGIEFKVLLNPVEFIGDNYVVNQIKFEIMSLGELDSSGRRKPVSTGKYTIFKIDSCIVSIGQKPNPILTKMTENLKTDAKGRIKIENYHTSIPGVFAGGDVVSGAATVILAMGAGKDAAEYMDKYIKDIKVNKNN